MNEQQILSEENNSNRKAFGKQRKWIFIGSLLFVLSIYILHWFGSWSTNYSQTITKNGSELSSQEINFTFNNRCLLFNETHSVDVYKTEGETKNNDNNLSWITLHSLRFTFIDHFLVLLIWLGVMFILYGFTEPERNKYSK